MPSIFQCDVSLIFLSRAFILEQLEQRDGRTTTVVTHDGSL